MAAYSNFMFGLRELKLKKGKFYSILDEEFGGLSPADGSWHTKRFPTRVRNLKEERNICKLNRR